MMDKIKPILGTMTFGPQVTTEEARAMMQYLANVGHAELDTAYVYNNGDTERMLGEILAQPETTTFRLATKVNPKVTGRLDKTAVFTQTDESLRRLRCDKLDILYLHFPDALTPIEETLEACAELYAEGKIFELGLSNFPAWAVVDIWHICKERGWIRPSIYQGLYNGLGRNVENELLPALRRLGMRFYAYNPLAGGLLSGKYGQHDEPPSPGRFTLRPNYRDRYWKKSCFDAISILSEQCKEEGVLLPAAALRWLAFHSKLEASRGDGIVLGVSKLSQLKQNMAALEEGPLSETIAKTFDVAWEITKFESPEYFRLYSS
jgi:aflatoxin B1 aldehyde reductase